MNMFAENAMLELSYLKSLHLKSTKQKRAVMGTVMEDEQKNSVKLSY